MVSLADRSQYLREFGSDRYAQAFVDFLMGSKVSADESSSGETANDLGIKALRAIQEDDEASFDRVYERISGRRPRRDSDWLYNDLLLFALAVGVVKFESDAGWLRDALQTRIESTEGESQLIARTLLDVVNGNFNSTNNHGPLLTVTKHVLDMPLGPPQHVNSVYRHLTEAPFPYHESSFLNIISIRAMDAIVLSKELGDFERQMATDRFLDSFSVKIGQVSFGIWAILLVALVTGSLCLGYLLWTAPEQKRGTFEIILALLPLLGLPGVLSLVGKKQQIEAWLKRRLLRFFNYPVQDSPRSGG